MSALITGLVCATVVGLAFVVRDVVLRVRAVDAGSLEAKRLAAVEAHAKDLETRLHSLEYKQRIK